MHYTREELPRLIFNNYFITEMGVAINKKTCRVIKTHVSAHGYLDLTVSIFGKRGIYSMHRLVALRFLPLVKGKPEVNHIDGNKRNNFLGNLEWVTHKENMRHAFESGFIHKGEKCSKSKLTEEQVNFIINNPEIKPIELSKKYNTCLSNISAIRTNKSWKHIPRQKRGLG